MAAPKQAVQRQHLQAPGAHVALVLLALAPLVVYLPVAANIVLTASLTVFVGCWRSIKPEPPAEAMSKKDAMKFPIIGSCVLFSLFLAFKFLPKHLVNAVLSAYFVLLGMLAIVATLEPLLAPLTGPFKAWAAVEREIRVPSIPLLLSDGLEFSFTHLELVAAVPASLFCVWYYRRKHWFANNALGLAFSLQGIEHLSLGTTQNGVILLCGLFFYDIFWVFATPVMVSVAKNFDAPIKLLFPRALEAAAAAAGSKRQFSMLGLGDIVIPGIFVALVLRYDAAHRTPQRSCNYFYSAFAGYVGGLVTTIVVMNVFEAAQPALLYIVPGVLGAVFLHAAVRGEAAALFNWVEKGEEEEGPKEGKEAAAAAGGKGAAALDGAAAPFAAATGGEASPTRLTRAAAKAAATPNKKDS